MRARKPRWYSLRQVKVRQSWNKHNLFNLLRKGLHPSRFQKTFFQQKWLAKSATRAYHGAHIKESDWSRMFSRRLFSAVDMPPEYLANFDGSEQAAGRGSGRRGETISAGGFSRYEKTRKANVPSHFNTPSSRLHNRYAAFDNGGKLLAQPIHEMTPYMQMAFAPMERRLDVAIFRAMFASSTLQAKQFCTHGAVKVNGKTMRYGSYLLNPGDMFQVNVDSVLYATGRPKTPAHALYLAGKDWASLNQLEAKKGSKNLTDAEASEQASADTPVEAEAEAALDEAIEDAESETNAAAAEEATELTEEERAAASKKQLKSLVRSAKDLIADGEGLNPRKKRQLRAFMSEAKRALSQVNRTTTTTPESTDAEASAAAAAASLRHDNVMDHLSTLLKDFKLDGSQVEAVGKEEQTKQPEPGAKEKSATQAVAELISDNDVRKAVEGLSKAEQDALANLLRKDAENPIDESKPYWTPWQPRRWMAPFAFIPRYLEVNQNICAAVYLRHPVARRGMAEVPTPFPYETNQLAFNWYLRRR
ncbi:37S ribosomal protein NAM9 [Colletotrichum trifolii]|uniref:37S ribosomal protein NAM9 n=1 Tax=Colletotrichum trifolii TaxID=5466 RepID=A0A4R8QWI9_COLTR|nr:37S ribosomal protein NAM9 [Colletotrichum trifolii]